MSLVGPDGRPLAPTLLRDKRERAADGCPTCGAPAAKIVNEGEGFGGHVSRVCLSCGADVPSEVSSDE